MNAKSLIAAAAVLLATGSAFAAESPAAPASAGAAGADSAGAAASPTPSNLPVARDEVKQDTADVVKHYKTPLAIQLEQYSK